MQFLTAEILVFMVTVLDGVQSELYYFGENVCKKRETYKESTPFKELKPRHSVRKSWCWDIRKYFSCDETVVSWEEHVEYVMVPKVRMVDRCCDGYVEQERGQYFRRTIQCVPHCMDGCYFGECLAPDTCVCNSGYYGHQCKKACPAGYWGVNCSNWCGCFNNGYCNFRVGCVCTSGWMGLRCELPCQGGFYGSFCKNKCDCAFDTCNHVTGECITSSEPSTTTSTTEVLLPVTTITKDVYPAGITTESLSTSTAYFATEAFTDLTEKTTTTNEISTVVINEIPIQIDSDSDFVTEISTTTEGTTERTESSSEAETRKETNLSEVVGLESSGETTSKRFTSTTQTRPFVDEITVANEKPETEVKINVIEQELNFRGSPDNINIPDSGTISSTIFIGTLNEPDVRENKTSWIGLKAGNEEMIKNKDIDKNKTDNFIFEEKGNSQSKETIFKFLHFLPSLSVISAVSFLMLVIAARWIIVNHRRKSRMVVVEAQKKNIFQSEEGVKFQAENLFWINNCTINPVYTSDVDLNNTTPILETFKPVDKELTMKERTIL